MPLDTIGSGDFTSPDPAVRGDRWDRYVAWCDRDSLDPFDDDNLEQFDIECDQALADAAAERHERETMWGNE